jgi:glycosyltransferase involved in cell wall biosynthesis
MSLKLLLISCYGYPSESNLYNSGFVHSRALAYRNGGHQVKVFVPDMSLKSPFTYQFEGIEVLTGTTEDLEKELAAFSPDRLLIHFINRHIMKFLYRNKFSVSTLIWVHGYEALAWYRIFFEFKSLKQFAFLALANTRQLFNLNRFISRSKGRILFVFVSRWMHRVASQDTLQTISNFRIIPNPIDSSLFAYQPKGAEARKQILLVRPFSTGKYANDLAIKAILTLAQEACFHDMSFTIVGKGDYFQDLTAPLRKYQNVTLINRFYTQSEMAAAHRDHGILLCPTRMDAQGVSMCEGMMSGLVPITSNNTAIPEFVTDGECGFLTNNHQEIAARIMELYRNPDLFLQMSAKAHFHIQELAGQEKVLMQELEAIQTEN